MKRLLELETDTLRVFIILFLLFFWQGAFLCVRWQAKHFYHSWTAANRFVCRRELPRFPSCRWRWRLCFFFIVCCTGFFCDFARIFVLSIHGRSGTDIHGYLACSLLGLPLLLAQVSPGLRSASVRHLRRVKPRQYLPQLRLLSTSTMSWTKRAGSRIARGGLAAGFLCHCPLHSCFMLLLLTERLCQRCDCFLFFCLFHDVVFFGSL